MVIIIADVVERLSNSHNLIIFQHRFSGRKRKYETDSG